jgi:4-hydroxy-2-oxoheptanedioate aldolase
MILREKMSQGGFCLGPFFKAASPALVEVMGYAGFDFVLLDMEHGPLSYEMLEHHILAAERVGLSPIVRVEAVSEPAIIRPLDRGAGGLLVPHVDSARMAEQVIRLSRYAPQGERGMDLFARAAQYGHLPKKEYLQQANDTLLALMIEGVEGFRSLKEILAVPGWDVIFVGPYDLSQSLGHPGEIDHPEVVGTVEQIVATVKKSGRHMGIFADNPQIAKRWIRLGVQFIALSVDTAIFYQACKKLIAEVRE